MYAILIKFNVNFVFYFQYFPTKKDYWTIDYKDESKVGDVVVIKNLATSQGRRLNTFIDSLLFQTGNTIDPVTNRRCRGLDFVDEGDRENEPSKRKNIELTSAMWILDQFISRIVFHSCVLKIQSVVCQMIMWYYHHVKYS